MKYEVSLEFVFLRLARIISSQSVAAGVVESREKSVSFGSVISRGICMFLVGNTAADLSFAALDRFLLFTSIRIAGGRIRRVILAPSNGARGAVTRR